MARKVNHTNCFLNNDTYFSRHRRAQEEHESGPEPKMKMEQQGHPSLGRDDMCVMLRHWMVLEQSDRLVLT
jgi:hypothetical protein